MSGAARREADSARDGTAPWEARNREVMELGLAWLRSLLEAHIATLRSTKPARTGLDGAPIHEGAMSDLEADWLLRDLATLRPEDSAAGSVTRSEARAAFEAIRSELREAGEPSALDRLSALFGLAPADEDLLLLAYAPRAEAGFQALYGYAHDRMSIAEATPHLARCLLAPEGGEAARHLATRLAPDASGARRPLAPLCHIAQR